MRVGGGDPLSHSLAMDPRIQEAIKLLAGVTAGLPGGCFHSVIQLVDAEGRHANFQINVSAKEIADEDVEVIAANLHMDKIE